VAVMVKKKDNSDVLVSAQNSYSELASLLTEQDIPIDVKDFSDFVMNVFSKGYPGFSFDTWHIHHMCNTFQRILDSPTDKYLLAVMPRYHLKSSILGYATSIYRMLTSFGEGLYTSYKEELAGVHLYHIKECIRNNPILSKFMVDLSPQSDTTINYKIGNRRVKIYAAGIGGVKRGLHTQVICLLPGTKVLTSPNANKKIGGGYRSIEQIKIGDKVQTHLKRPRVVTNTFCRDISEEIIILYLDNNEIIKVTSNHPILTKYNGWKNAGYLTTDDILMKLKYPPSKLKNKTYEEIHGEENASILRKNKFNNIDRSSQCKPTKNKTYEEYFGFEKAKEIKDRQSKVKIGVLTKERIDRECLICGKIFNIISSSKKLFCSRGCSSKFYGVGANFRAKVGNFRGSNNPNWKGGGVYPEVFNKELKYKIFVRDNFTCQKCGQYGGMLNCHHIDYNKENCEETNLITTCRACNFAVNNKREYWKNLFSIKIAEKYQLIANGTYIKKIEHLFYSGKVYNLEVEEDNTYCGKGIIFHNCINDDLMGDLRNPMTFTDIEKTIRIFEAEIMNIPNKECPTIVFGTVISDNDLLFRLKERPQFSKNMIWMPALYPDGEHEVLWESMYNRQWLEQRKIDGGWKAFSTEFLLIPVLSTEAFFNRDQLDKIIDTGLTNFAVPGY
jgi:hypothetical protein